MRIAKAKNLPPILYKYRYFDPDGYHLKIITDTALWFTSSREFNDPFDTTIPFRFKNVSTAQWTRWANDFMKRERPDLNKQERRRLIQQRKKVIFSNPRKWHERFNQQNIEDVQRKLGICCLSARRDDLLMWSHYSDSHKGFCVGIALSKLGDLQEKLAKPQNGRGEFLDLIKVNYKDEMPQIDFISAMLYDREDHNYFYTMMGTKYSAWEYEEEYRLVYWKHPNTALEMGQDAIVEVILGCQISAENQAAILSAIRSSNNHPEVFKAQKKDGRFALKLDLLM